MNIIYFVKPYSKIIITIVVLAINIVFGIIMIYLCHIIQASTAPQELHEDDKNGIRDLYNAAFIPPPTLPPTTTTTTPPLPPPPPTPTPPGYSCFYKLSPFDPRTDPKATKSWCWKLCGPYCK